MARLPSYPHGLLGAIYEGIQERFSNLVGLDSGLGHILEQVKLASPASAGSATNWY